MKGSLLVTCFLLVSLGRGDTNRFFPRGDLAVINEAGHLATSYMVLGLNVSFYRLNYVNPGRVLLFQDDCDLYPSIEVAPFSATGLSDLKRSFSGNFYYNSLSDREDAEVLADISGIVSASTPGKEHGVFEAQFGEVFTWENVSYKSTRAAFQMVVVSSTEGGTFVMFVYNSVSHDETGEFEVFSGLSVQHTDSTSTVIVSFPSHKALTRGNTAEDNSSTFVFKVDAISCYEEDLSAYICINDTSQDVTVSDNSVIITFKELLTLTAQSEDDIQYIVDCMAVGVNGSTVSSTLNTSSIVEGVHQVTLTGLSPSTTYNCSVTRYHSARSNTTQYLMFVTDPPEKEEEEEGLSPGAIAGIVIGSVAAVALAAVGLGGVAALVKGGAPCCGGGAAEVAEGADPVAITEAGISIAEFVKEHCTCCCKKKDEEEDKGSKKRVKVDDDHDDDTENMLKDDTTEKTTAV